MRCTNPYIAPGRKAFGCGQCLPCRVNRRRVWAHRIMLEASLHSDNSFVTLTYDDEHLPSGGHLVPKHTQDFLKRLRKSIEPVKVRYYLVGEYGDQSHRPHYHAALFGYPPCEHGLTSPNRRGDCCRVCDGLRRIWGLGNIYSGGVSYESANYIAGYVTKKLTAKGDPKLDGKEPEFARQSNRPGIGAFFMDEVASTLLERNLDSLPDVPVTLRHGNRIMPLGRYLTRRLRTRMGKEEAAPYGKYQAQMDEKMQRLFEEAISVNKTQTKLLVHHWLSEESKQVERNLAAKNKPKKGHL